MVPDLQGRVIVLQFSHPAIKQELPDVRDNRYFQQGRTRVFDALVVCEFDKTVIEFINKRTVTKANLPLNCLRLYTTRALVDAANATDFKHFSTQQGYTIDADDSYTGAEGTARAALKETRLLATLLLKKHMPVMLIQYLNVAEGWVNGTVATISRVDDLNIRLMKIIEGEKFYYNIQRITRQVPGTSYIRSQFPIVPAFATTIHKAQSATIDCVGIHLGDMLTHGQLYVVMSHVRRTEDLFFFGADVPLKIKRKYGCDADAMEIIRRKVESLQN